MDVILWNTPRSLEFRAGEPANFLSAPAPHFFFKRLRLLVFSQAAPAPGIFFRAAPAPRTFFPSGSGSWFFFQAAPAPTGSGSPALLELQWAKAFSTLTNKQYKHTTAYVLPPRQERTKIFFTFQRLDVNNQLAVCLNSSRLCVLGWVKT